MRRALAPLAFALVSLLGLMARAAPVDVYVGYDLGFGARIYAAPAPDVGNIALYAVGYDRMTLQPLPQISIPDSRFYGGLAGATLLITSSVGQNLLQAAAGSTQRIHLATLTRSSCCIGGPVSSGDDAFGYTVLNQDLTEPIPYRLYLINHDGYPELVDYWLPEPGTPELLGLGLAALALARRAT